MVNSQVSNAYAQLVQLEGIKVHGRAPGWTTVAGHGD